MMNQHMEFILNSTPAEKIPKATKDAMEFEKAARELLAEYEAPSSVDLTQATKPADLRRVIQAATDAAATREISAGFARELVKIATDRTESTWGTDAARLMPYFGELFDAAAARLYAFAKKHPDMHEKLKQHWTPEGQELNEIVSELDRLSRIRDAYALYHGSLSAFPVSKEYEKSSRTAIFPNASAEQDFRFRYRQREQNYWLTLAEYPDTQIKWQTRQQQLEQKEAAHNLRAQEAMAQQNSLIANRDTAGHVTSYTAA